MHIATQIAIEQILLLLSHICYVMLLRTFVVYAMEHTHQQLIDNFSIHMVTANENKPSNALLQLLRNFFLVSLTMKRLLFYSATKMDIICMLASLLCTEKHGTQSLSALIGLVSAQGTRNPLLRPQQGCCYYLNHVTLYNDDNKRNLALRHGIGIIISIRLSIYTL